MFYLAQFPKVNSCYSMQYNLFYFSIEWCSVIIHAKAVHRFIWWSIAIFCFGTIRILLLWISLYIKVWILNVTQALSDKGWYLVASTIVRWKNLQKVESGRIKVGHWQYVLGGNIGVLVFSIIQLLVLCDNHQICYQGDLHHDVLLTACPKWQGQASIERKLWNCALRWTVISFKVISLIVLSQL